MHVLLIHQAYTALDEAGGTRHEEMSRYLSEKGHKVTVITSPVSYLTGESNTNNGFNKKGPSDHNLEVIRSYSLPGIHRSFYKRLVGFVVFSITSFFNALRVKNVDIVWGTSPPLFQGFSACLVSRVKRKPFLFEVRDLWPAFAIAVGVLKNPLLISASLWLEKFLYRHADCVLVNSPGFIDHVKQEGATRVELIPNGADQDMFDPDNHGTEFRKAHGLEGKFLAMYAGAHGLSNDLGIILEAANLLKVKPEIQFVLLGDGKEKPALRQLAEKMGLHNLLFLPSIPKRQMGAALAAADACIAILKPIEPFKTTYPNKVFDYMAAGRPVILAIDGVIRQVVENNKAGIFIHPGRADELAAAVLKIMEHPETGMEMGRAGRRVIERSYNREIRSGELEWLLIDMIKNKFRQGECKD